MSKAEERSAARDFVMARLGVALASVRNVDDAIGEALSLFADPESDPKGKKRAGALEVAETWLGEATRAVQAAGELLGDIDPKEGEPDLPEGDGEDPDEDDEDDEDDE